MTDADEVLTRITDGLRAVHPRFEHAIGIAGRASFDVLFKAVPVRRVSYRDVGDIRLVVDGAEGWGLRDIPDTIRVGEAFDPEIR